ncbi:MAG TPA: BatD family protein [Candidatus Hydrogenedentes bacterium]|nr:BatD family protein [Candidatus Hydrogenedentota bacterium]HOL75792.1 BatD family protein [Candidatus Hydrogenedentota bacterium]HPO84214.1 BatD family protein [Candidatus Hydrogenedentota bacterium]
MHRMNLLLTLFVFGILTGTLPAAEVNVYVQPDTVRKGQVFQLIVEARGEQVSEPQLPKIDGLNINTTPNITEDRWSLSPAGQEHIKIRGYRAYAEQAMTITIPPITVEIDGKPEQSKTFQLKILEPNVAEPAQSTTPSTPNKPSSSAGNTQLSWDDLLIAQSEVDKTSVYIQQPIILRLKRLEIRHPRVQVRVYEETEPQTQGFYVTAIDPGTFFPTTTTINGFEYQVTECIRVLYPTQSGELRIEPWECRGAARVRDGLRFIDNELNPISDVLLIHVKPLPPAPESFSGAVGKFQLESSLEPRETTEGVPVVLTLRVQGNGNPNAIGQPKIPEVQNVTMSLSDTTVSQVPNPSEPTFEKVFRYNVTPLKSGEILIPEFEFTYFDPDLETYVPQKSGPFSLVVKPALKSEKRFIDFSKSQGSEQRQVEILGHDINPIVLEISGLSAKHSNRFFTWFAIVFPVAAYSVVALAASRQRKLKSNPSYARFRLAKRRALTKLKNIKDSSDPVGEVYRVLISFLADKLDKAEASLTTSDIEKLLEDSGVNDTLRATVLRILRKCERSRYASASVSPEELDALVQGATAVVTELESHFRSTRC